MTEDNMMYFYYFGFTGLVLALIVWIDADRQYNSGGIWGLLMFFFWPLLLPLYVALRFRHARGMSTVESERRAAERERWPRMGGDIYTMKYRKLAEQGGGTLYEPPDRGGLRGYKHFTDERAEALLRERQYQQAWEYLSELYLLAASEADAQRRETYCHYVGLLPQGKERLLELLAREQPVVGSLEQPAAPAGAADVAGRQAKF